jgi:hypothetical protein
MWKRKSKQQQEEKAEAKEEAATQEPATEQTTQEAPVAQGAVAPEAEEVPAAAPEAQEPAAAAAAAAPEPEPEGPAAKETAPEQREAPRQNDTVPDITTTPAAKETALEQREAPRQNDTVPDITTSFLAPISPPVSLTYEPAQDEDRPGMLRSQTGPRDAAATGGPSTMHNIQPITSPRADSKLKTWFRDRLVRRPSEPQPIYPHQPSPDYNTDSESAFTGGAALTGRIEPRGAALSSHPVSTEDLESEHGENGGTTRSFTEEPTNSHQATQNGNSSGESKRHRLRRSFMKTVTRNSQELKTNGTDHKRQSSEAVGSSDLQALRDSATEQGLPAPPVIGDTPSMHRESRFSEDL